MKNTLNDALRSAFEKELTIEGLSISDISNYNISRAASTGVFTFVLYKNTKTKKGDKKSIKVKLDSSTSTLVAAIDMLDLMIAEAASKSFLSMNETTNTVRGF